MHCFYPERQHGHCYPNSLDWSIVSCINHKVTDLSRPKASCEDPCHREVWDLPVLLPDVASLSHTTPGLPSNVLAYSSFCYLCCLKVVCFATELLKAVPTSGCFFVASARYPITPLFAGFSHVDLHHQSRSSRGRGDPDCRWLVATSGAAGHPRARLTSRDV
jgi:hypothetical protein